MCSATCLKVSLLVFLSISLVFSQLHIITFMLLSYWLSLILAVTLFATLFTLAFYGNLAESYIALYVYVGMQVTAWLMEFILLMTVGIHIIGWDIEKLVLKAQEIKNYHFDTTGKILPFKREKGRALTYSGKDVLENYLRHFSHIPIVCCSSDEIKSSRLCELKRNGNSLYSVRYQNAFECEVTLLAWFTVLRDIYDFISVVLAAMYAWYLHNEKADQRQPDPPPTVAPKEGPISDAKVTITNELSKKDDLEEKDNT